MPRTTKKEMLILTCEPILTKDAIQLYTETIVYKNEEELEELEQGLFEMYSTNMNNVFIFPLEQYKHLLSDDKTKITLPVIRNDEESKYWDWKAFCESGYN
jgi:hypothetical protein